MSTRVTRTPRRPSTADSTTVYNRASTVSNSLGYNRASAIQWTPDVEMKSELPPMSPEEDLLQDYYQALALRRMSSLPVFGIRDDEQLPVVLLVPVPPVPPVPPIPPIPALHGPSKLRKPVAECPSSPSSSATHESSLESQKSKSESDHEVVVRRKPSTVHWLTQKPTPKPQSQPRNPLRRVMSSVARRLHVNGG